MKITSKLHVYVQNLTIFVFYISQYAYFQYGGCPPSWIFKICKFHFPHGYIVKVWRENDSV